MKIYFLVLVFVLNLFANDNITVFKDLKYSSYKKTSLDIYLPKKALNKKVIFMVHGGGWVIGDKSSKNVVKNKVNYWVSKGYIFISTNYRLVPNVNVYEQAKDVARALSFSQKYLLKYGVNSKDFILMGHSAGAHLVSLVATNKKLVDKMNIKPWRGTISIDTGVFNLPELMSKKHLALFDKAFGKDKEFWNKVSPYHQLNTKLYPFLVICSTKRKESCKKIESFVSKAKLLGSQIEVLKINLNHRNLNKRLGLKNRYTKEVNSFISKL